MTIQSFVTLISSETSSVPMYQKIKEHILQKIAQGEWQPNQKIPSENEIAGLLNISRMTVNRAFKELTEEGYLFREKGSGTFVAAPFQLLPFFELSPISQEIALEGRKFSTKILQLCEVKADALDVLKHFDVSKKDALLCSEMIYLSDHVPIQYEKRYVLPEFMPNYLTVDFQKQCSLSWLLNGAVVLSQTHTLEAVISDDDLDDYLEISHEACFKITEKLLLNNRVISIAEQYCPSSRFRFNSKI